MVVDDATLPGKHNTCFGEGRSAISGADDTLGRVGPPKRVAISCGHRFYEERREARCQDGPTSAGMGNACVGEGTWETISGEDCTVVTRLEVRFLTFSKDAGFVGLRSQRICSRSRLNVFVAPLPPRRM